MEGREALHQAAAVLAAVGDADPMKERCDELLAIVRLLTPRAICPPDPEIPA